MSPGQEAGLAVLAEPDEPSGPSISISLGIHVATRRATAPAFHLGPVAVGGGVARRETGRRRRRRIPALLCLPRGPERGPGRPAPVPPLGRGLPWSSAPLIRSLYATEAVMAAAGVLPELPTI